MIDIIKKAVEKGAKIYSNVSGGKDGQAMTKVLLNNNFSIEGLIHADLGRAEWKESLGQCEKLAVLHGLKLNVVTRADGRSMVDHWKDRMKKLQYKACDVATREEIIVQPTPFWSSSSSRYCTSDMKRDPINAFYTSTGHDLIISCEGIRSNESVARSKKSPLSIRERSSSKFYKGMTVEEAIANFQPGKRLVLTWFPIFNFTTEEVWNTYGLKEIDLIQARESFLHDGNVPAWWLFHPAYVYGNERVSCALCVLASESDLKIGAKHNPELYEELVQMEIESGFTFRNNFSLQTMSKIKK